MNAVRSSDVAPWIAAEIPRVRSSRAARIRTRPGAGTVARGSTLVTLSHGSTFAVAATSGTVNADDGSGQGFYCDDTRFVSGHVLRLNGRPLSLMGEADLSYEHARWVYSATRVSSVDSPSNPDARVTVTVDRVVQDRRIHEDITLHSYGHAPVSLPLSLSLEVDFADIFEVRSERWQRRSGVTTAWTPPNRLETRYQRNGFMRRCLLRISPAHVGISYVNGDLRFPVDLAPGREWKVCLQYDLVSTVQARPPLSACPFAEAEQNRSARGRRAWHRTAAGFECADGRLVRAYDQAVDDFAALRLGYRDLPADMWVPAAGIPWFVALFGRDSVIASLQALPVHPLFALGTLHKLAQWQSTVDDAVRDAEPGKICHEMRLGEWAQFRIVPHSPYYGTADATPLYLMLLAETYRWMGDAARLRRFRGTAERCLEWIDRHGDRDGDGLQEYGPRTPQGYRNQCWRDAEDGVLDEDGRFPDPPIGTCEMQAYVHAAKLGMAPLFEAWGEPARAAALRQEADDLRRRFVAAYWLDGTRELAFALDGSKRPLRTATSNPGHCLWLGMLDRARGDAVADRLMRPDLMSGWGLRVLSDRHPAYDPHAYQRGSVWPHDTMIAAAGLRRYGRTEDAWRLIDGLLAAVSCFDKAQMPELFAGLARGDLAVPVPYERANVPQAWAAGAVFHAVRVLLGLEPDVPNGAVYLDPALPPWCHELELSNIRVGDDSLSLRARRRGDGTCDVEVTERPRHLRVVHAPSPWQALPG